MIPLWPAVFAVWGTGARTSLHAHHAWHLMVGLDGPILIQSLADGRPLSAPAFLIRPDVPHAADGNGGRVVVVFVVPEAEAGAQLATTSADGIHILPPEAVERIRAALGSPRTAEELSDGAARALAELGVEDGRAKIRHPGVRKVLRAVRAGARGAELSLEALAAISGLSPSRFLHVFSSELGIPLRPYLRWLKVEHASALLTAGAPFAHAATAAGFADAAHMTRTFRAMLGLAPSALLRSQSVQAG